MIIYTAFLTACEKKKQDMNTCSCERIQEWFLSFLSLRTDTFWRSTPQSSKKKPKGITFTTHEKENYQVLWVLEQITPVLFPALWMISVLCLWSFMVLVHFLFLRLFSLPCIAVANSVSLVCMSCLRDVGLGLGYFKIL